MSFVSGSSKLTQVGQFMRLNPPIFTGTKVKKDPQWFIDEMVKNFRVMHLMKLKGLSWQPIS